MNIQSFDSTIVYEDLPDDHIRVLILEPGTFGQALHGSFKYQKVSYTTEEHGLPYKALSYTWGLIRFTQHIVCGNIEIPITQNLFEALQHVRHTQEITAIWIDALCINQNDIPEKSKQIPIMRCIYENAEQVLIWLGLGDESTEKALALIQQAARYARAEKEDVSKVLNELQGLSRRNSGTGFPSRYGPERASFDALNSFLELPWFTRAWIIQEVVAARSAVMMIGKLRLSYSDFCTSMMFFQRKGYDFRAQKRDLIRDMVVLTHMSREVMPDNLPKSTNLMFLLQATRHFLVTEPRDKVFALVGLASKGIKGGHFPVTYDRDMKEICFGTVLHYLVEEEEGRLDPFAFLSHVDHGRDDIDPAFPSWVPRWHVPRTCHQNIWRPYDISSFNAGGNHDTMISPELTDDQLRVRGYVVGIVEKATERSTGFIDSDWNVDMMDLLKLLKSVYGLVENIKTKYPTGEEYHDVLAQVLSAGSTIIEDGVERKYNSLDLAHLFIHTNVEFLEICKDRYENLDLYELPWFQEMERALPEQPKGNFPSLVKFYTMGRKIFRTNEGLIGLGPCILKPGDMVCVFYNGSVPYMLRPVQDGFRFLGECYLHGVMNRDLLEDSWQRRSFVLI
jgi:hypothetical protein